MRPFSRVATPHANEVGAGVTHGKAESCPSIHKYTDNTNTDYTPTIPAYTHTYAYGKYTAFHTYIILITAVCLRKRTGYRYIIAVPPRLATPARGDIPV